MPWMIPDSPDENLQLIKDVNRKAFAVHLDFVNMINSPKDIFSVMNSLKNALQN